VFDFSARVDEWRRMLATLELLAAAVAGVALLSGAAGTANVMFLSFSEQIREIGVRRSLGATIGSIRRQFLLQATVIATVGAVAGAGAGVCAIGAIGQLLDGHERGWITTFALRPALLSLAAAYAATLLASLLPARRGRRLSVLDCLRARS
jgi:putative ABC transport system permease protein